MKGKLSFLIVLLFVVSSILYAEDGQVYTQRKGIRIKYADTAESNSYSQSSTVNNSFRPFPIYISELSNINDYNLFANSGWDGNWYAGFNVCWMEELPPPPEGEYKRAYIGVKLGRMKTQSVKGRPVWEKQPIPGSIYVAISAVPSWRETQGFLLTDTQDIPLEGDAENALEGTGESRWFWTEIPIEQIQFRGPNYIALWSPSEYFISTTSSPIIAGGWGSQKANSWMNNDVRGYPPLNPATALKTPISVFEPAIVLKLIPVGTEQSISVMIEAIKPGNEKTGTKTVIARVSGDEIEKTWLEVSENDGKWKKQGSYVYSAPFMLTLKPLQLSQGKICVRCAAMDIWGNIGYSESQELPIQNPVPVSK